MELSETVKQIVEKHPSQLEMLRSGQHPQLIGFFLGQVIRATKNAVPASEIRALLLTYLPEESS